MVRRRFLVAVVGFFACTGPASAQGLTAEDRLRELADSGIFDRGTDVLDIPRDQLASLLRLIMDLPSETPDPGPGFTDISTGDWTSAFIQAMSEAGVLSDVFNPSNELSQSELSEIIAEGISGTPTLEVPVVQVSDWVQQYVEAAIAGDLLPTEPTQAGLAELEESLPDDVPDDDVPDDDIPDGGVWEDYPYYLADERTAVLPTNDETFPAPLLATYSGIVLGTDATGHALSGTSHFDVGFHPGGADLQGSFSFDTGDIVRLGGFDSSGGAVDLVFFSDPFQGGVIGDSEVDAGFYGPNAEELAGDWAFTVIGGTSPGTASGEFASKR